MPFTISEKSERALLSLFPRVQGRADAPTWLVDQVVDAELHRAGHADPTGALHALALNQGSLMKEEYDLSTHGHADGWVMEALVVDPRELTLFNMRHGFPAGDAALRAMVATMKELSPRAKVVRTHTDGFAILLGPTADTRLQPALRASLELALPRAVAAVTPTPEAPMGFTFGQLRLTVVDPPNWQVLGPLVWAECERTLIIARRAPFTDVLDRRVVLDGRLPEFTR
ncbi:MAG: GGDEF domain-containing protein [Myxococcus sp.]|nr:GGDEF domain-containing protein [Myxococcus sp.]